MTDLLRRFSWPLPWWYLPIPALAILAITLGSTWQMLSWPYQEWQLTSAQFHQQTAWVAPASATVAAFVAGKLTAPSRIFALPTSSRVGTPAARRHLSQLGGIFVGAYVLGLIPLVVVTVLDAHFGGPDLLVMASGLLGVTVAIAVGYLIGVLARTPLIAPVAFLLFFAATAIGFREDTFAAVLPVLHIEPQLGQVENTPMVLFRCGFFLLVTLIAGGVAARVLSNRADRTVSSTSTSIAVAAIPVVLAILGTANTPALFALPADPPRHCTEHNGIEYCVHEGHRTELPLLINALDPVFTLYVEQQQIQRVYDRSLLYGNGKLAEIHNSGNAGATHITVPHPRTAMNDLENRQSEASSLASELTGSWACTERFPELSGSTINGDHPFDRSMELAQRLTTPDGASYPDNPFTGLSDAELRDWIAINQDAITSCSIEESDLPA